MSEDIWFNHRGLNDYPTSNLVILRNAFETLINDEWYGQECENANYHNEIDWLQENLDDVLVELQDRNNE